MDGTFRHSEAPEGLKPLNGGLLVLILKILLAPFVGAYMILREGERFFRRTTYNEDFTDFRGAGGARKVFGLLLGLGAAIWVHGLGAGYFSYLKLAEWTWYLSGLVVAPVTYAYLFPATHLVLSRLSKLVLPRLHQLLTVVWSSIARAGRWLGVRFWRVATWVWGKLWTFVHTVVVWLWDKVVRLARWVWEQVVWAWQNIRRMLEMCLKFGKAVIANTFNFMRQPFERTYKDDGDFKALFLHVCNVGVLVGLGTAGVLLLPLLMPTWAAIVSTIPVLLISYLMLGNLLLRTGNWAVGGVLGFAAAYFAGIATNMRWGHGFWVSLAVSVVAGGATFLIVFPTVYASVRSIVTGLGLEKVLLSFFATIYNWVTSVLSGLRDLCVELYVSIRDAVVSMADRTVELCTEVAGSLSMWWRKHTRS